MLLMFVALRIQLKFKARKNLDLEHIPGLRAFNIDRAGEGPAVEALLLHVFVHRLHEVGDFRL